MIRTTRNASALLVTAALLGCLCAPDGSVPFVGRNEILLVEDVLEGVRIALAPLPGEMP